MIELWPGRAHPAMAMSFPDADRTRARPALVVFRGAFGAFGLKSPGGE